MALSFREKRPRVARCGGNHKVQSFTCLDQFLCMAFVQLTFRESLGDIEVCLRPQAEKLYHMGIRGQVSRNTLANATAACDDFAQRLIGIARKLYVNEPFGVDLSNTAYALDSTTIDWRIYALSLSLFPWAPFRTTKAAVKMHTLLDLRGNIPSFIHISDGKLHDVNILDQLIAEAPGPATSWIAATSTSCACIGCIRPAASLSPAQSGTWTRSGAIRIPWTDPPE